MKKNEEDCTFALVPMHANKTMPNLSQAASVVNQKQSSIDKYFAQDIATGTWYVLEHYIINDDPILTERVNNELMALDKTGSLSCCLRTTVNVQANLANDINTTTQSIMKISNDAKEVIDEHKKQILHEDDDYKITALNVNLFGEITTTIENKRKIMQAELGTTREAQIVEAVQSPESRNEFYIARKYYPGENLQALREKELKGEVSLTIDTKIDIALKCIKFLDDLHKMGIIHCDINPNNIIYDRALNSVRILDFDTSLNKRDKYTTYAETYDPHPRGTAGYIAPEILSGKSSISDKDKNLHFYSERADVYALGVTLAKLFGLDEYLGKKSSNTTSFIDKPVKSATGLNDEQKRLLKILTAMTSMSLDNRLQLDAAKKQFRNLQKQLLAPQEGPDKKKQRRQ